MNHSLIYYSSNRKLARLTIVRAFFSVEFQTIVQLLLRDSARICDGTPRFPKVVKVEQQAPIRCHFDKGWRHDLHDRLFIKTRHDILGDIH